MLEIRCRHDEGSVVLELDGEICVLTVPMLTSCLDALGEMDSYHVIVDMTDVRLLSAQGVGVLLKAAHQRERAGGSLTVRGATGLVAQVLEITGVVSERVELQAQPGAA